MDTSDWPGHVEWLNQESVRLLEFGKAAVAARNGFAWLDEDGRPDLRAPLKLWITCRFTHVFALGALMHQPGCAELVDHGLAALAGPFADSECGGWYA
ncbi:MAG: AGE family epimerase/isomerase, partial [Bifidobacteriaceae bacterium]|nr:AGE family epimerase/isomerase [Bifidobacteriaceae bacterium]